MLPRFALSRARRFFDLHGWPVTRAVARSYRGTLARRLRVIAVIGSFGKTTTTRAVAAALGVRPHNRNAFSRVALSLLSTPPWQRWHVQEVGIGRRGQMIAHARSLRPDIVVVTSIGSEHNRSLGTLAEIAAEKARMFEGLRPGGWIVANVDDPHVRAMVRGRDARLVGFGFDADARVRALAFEPDGLCGSVLTASVDGECVVVRTPLIGRAMVYPLLAALAVARIEQVPLEAAAAGLGELQPAVERLALEPLPGGAWLLLDSFKGAVETYEAALDALDALPGRRLAIVGEVESPIGSQGEIYRRLGARLARTAAKIVVLGGRKTFASYRAGASAAGLDRGRFVHAGRSVHTAAELLAAELQPGDVVLVKAAARQRAARAALLLAGEAVSCRLVDCRAPAAIVCRHCPERQRALSPPGT